jgi:8-oxo-dGTP pyrophosphatase MutT (NUDIX family)
MMQKSEWIPNEIYGEFMKNLPIFCVDIIIFDESKTKILLGKRNNEPLKNEYFSIGGRLQKGEEIKSCAARKAKEELGIDISTEHLLSGGVINEIHPNSSFGKDIEYHAVTVFYGYCIQPNAEVCLDSQHSEFKWFDISDSSIHPNVKYRINSIIEKI